MSNKYFFDSCVGNPPYMIFTGGGSKTAKNQAVPIYQYFLDAALKLKVRLISAVIPSRWFASGMQAIEPFREQITQDRHIKTIKDFADSKQCFADTGISGGVCIILRDSEYAGKCFFLDRNSAMQRYLDEFEVLVRHNEAVSILHKIREQGFMPLSQIVSPACPFGLSTNVRGRAAKSAKDCLTLYSSTGKTYLSPSEVRKGHNLIGRYKVMVGKMASEHAGEPSKADGRHKVFTDSMRVLLPGEICTHSYFCCGSFKSLAEAENLCAYLKSRFVRFLVLASLTATNLSRKNFVFVPCQKFGADSDLDWQKPIDCQLYQKYSLSATEAAFIESLIRPL